MDEWKDVPISISLHLKKMDKRDLPKFIGKSHFLDTKISNFIRDDFISHVWFYYYEKDLYFLNKDLYKFLNSNSVKLTITALCTGYYDEAYPPEGEDDRIIDSISLTNEFGNVYSVEKKYFDLFEWEFSFYIYETEIKNGRCINGL